MSYFSDSLELAKRPRPKPKTSNKPQRDWYRLVQRMRTRNPPKVRITKVELRDMLTEAVHNTKINGE